jgi:hypothetical protein
MFLSKSIPSVGFLELKLELGFGIERGERGLLSSIIGSE